MQDDLTTLVCLFHHTDQAHAAVHDLRDAKVPESSITILGGNGSGVDALDRSELSSLGMPDRDYDHLKKGVASGNTVVAVSAAADKVAAVEKVFAKHRAEKIDEADTSHSPVAAAPVIAAPVAQVVDTSVVTGETAIPIAEESLIVGKRTVDQGGVRLYRRVVEVPVEESIQLREEHVNVDRVRVDRAVTDADQAFQNRTLELTETAEEAVVGKEARVVEEVVLSKGVTEHTETVRDTVRHTEVEVEQLPSTETFERTTNGSY